MKSLKASVWLLGLACAAFAVSGAAAAAEKAGEAKHNLLYLCTCGADCKCTTVSTKPGQCKCKMELKPFHLLKVEKHEALVCACGQACECKVDSKDPGKCGCGKAVRRVSLKGTGVYFCNCGGSCTCNTVSAKPAKCGCGMDLIKAD